MKRLFFVRHGKSSWDHEAQDHQRPLKKRAYKDAAVVIAAVKEKLDVPVTIWSSYAKRALETARMFKGELEVREENFVVREDLYTFHSKNLLAVIKSCEDSIDTLMVFGHNPAMTGVVNRLGKEHFQNVPTTGLVYIEFDTDSWENLQTGNTLYYLFPKNLR